MGSEFASGASAARNKLLRHFRDNGFPVKVSGYGCPPKDEDFLAAVLTRVRTEPLGDQRALVIFRWWQNLYQIFIPASVPERLTHSHEERYDLFSAMNGKYQHRFYLAQGDDGHAVVHHERLWSAATNKEDTTIVLFG